MEDMVISMGYGAINREGNEGNEWNCQRAFEWFGMELKAVHPRNDKNTHHCKDHNVVDIG
jgi:hypothetical protein